MSDVVDHEMLKEVKAFMREGYARLIEVYVKAADGHVARLEEALGSADFVVMHESAHAMKSSSGNVGLTRVSELCREIERLAKAQGDEGEAAVPEGLRAKILELAEIYPKARTILQQSV